MEVSRPQAQLNCSQPLAVILSNWAQRSSREPPLEHMPEQSDPLLSPAKDRRDKDNLENLTGHQDLGRATKGSLLQNFRVLQGVSEILPTLQDLGEV